MNENANEGIKIGGNVLFAIAIVSVVAFLVIKGINFTNSSNKKYDTTTAAVTNIQYEDYDNKTVTGSQAINAIKLDANDNFSVTVITRSNSSGVKYTSQNGYSTSDITNPNYIEPTATFYSTLDKNNNKSTTGITLVQQ